MRIHPLGTTSLRVSEVCMGTSPLGSMPQAYGYEVSDEHAHDAVRELFGSSVNFLDTSNEYSAGESERRIGHVVRERDGLPEGFVLATKVDPAAGVSQLPAARVRESFTESTGRLGVDYIPLLYLHDPWRFDIDELLAPGGAVEAMTRLKDEGAVGHLGVADYKVDLLRRLVDTGLFEVVLNHNQFSLLNRSAETLIEYAHQHGVAFINAAPYAGGILAKGPAEQPRYAYSEASGDVVRCVNRMQSTCREFGVDLATAALQFSTRDPRIASTVVGVSKPGRIASIVQSAETVVPDELWQRLDELRPEPG